jgi:arylsulfatase A-like enzyme
MYDLILRVPLIAWAPGRYPAGVEIDGLCQHMDVGPAMLELAGLKPAGSLEAVSLTGALEGGDWTPRPHVYAEHGKDAILQGTEFVTMVRDARWKLVHFLDEPWGQLFDLETDPTEVVNRWDDPAAADAKGALLDELREWRIRSGWHTSCWPAEWR